MSSTAPARRIGVYYVLELLSAAACTLYSVGIFFWTRERFGFSDTANLLLGATNGLVYVPMAWWGGRWVDRVGGDRALRWGFGGCALALAGVAWLPWPVAAFLGMAIYIGGVAPTWPALEAAIMHAPVGGPAPRRLGIYNLVWAGGNALAALGGVWLFRRQPSAIFWLPALVYAGMALALCRAPRHVYAPLGAAPPPVFAPDARPAAKIAARRRFMRLGRMANALGYVLLGAFTALLPALSERLRWTPGQGFWLITLLYAARVAVFAILTYWTGWQDRRGWSWAALWAAPAALLVAFTAWHPALTLLALVVFGAAIGLSYSASIVYSLDQATSGRGGEGGAHEAALGLGVLIGPLVGAGGAAALGSAFGAMLAVAVGAGLCNLLSLHPWFNPRAAADA